MGIATSALILGMNTRPLDLPVSRSSNRYVDRRDHRHRRRWLFPRFLGVRYPSDVIAGWALGAIGAVVVTTFAELSEQNTAAWDRQPHPN